MISSKQNSVLGRLFKPQVTQADIVPQYQSSKITVFVWDKNTILKFLGNTI